MASLLSKIDIAFLSRLVPAVPGRPGQKRIVQKTAEYLPAVLDYANITTPLRIAHFLAQLAHESDGFVTTEEYASGRAYEGRTKLGNTTPGDGVRFKGRGLIQLTGRRNYTNFTKWLRKVRPDCPDFEMYPELAAMFPSAVWTAGWYWTKRQINNLADRDDVLSVTKAVNGGTNGLLVRKAYLLKAKKLIVMLEQRALADSGFSPGKIDGLAGPQTYDAIRLFQQCNHLAVDGIIGPKTTALLFGGSQ